MSNRVSLSRSTKKWLNSFPEDWPDVQFIPMESAGFQGAPEGQHFMAISASILSPKSKGNMTISSGSMLDSPVISPNWLQDEADVEMAYATMVRLREIGKNWDSSVNLGEILPGPTVTTKKQMIEWLRNNMFMMSHGSSTCKFSPICVSSEGCRSLWFFFQARWVPTRRPTLSTPEAEFMVSPVSVLVMRAASRSAPLDFPCRPSVSLDCLCICSLEILTNYL